LIRSEEETSGVALLHGVGLVIRGNARSDSDLVVGAHVSLGAIGLKVVPVLVDLVSHVDLSTKGLDPLGVLSSSEVSVDHATVLNNGVIAAESEGVVAGAGGVPGLEQAGLGGNGGGLDGIASLGAFVLDLTGEDLLSLFGAAPDLNPDAAPVREVLLVARESGVKRVGGDDGATTGGNDLFLLANVDGGRVVLGVAGLKGDGSILVVEVEVEGLGGVDVSNAYIVLVNPAGV